MTKTRVKTAFILLQIICLVVGGAITLILNASGFHPAQGNNELIYSVVVLVALAFVVVIEIGSALKIHDSTVHTVFTSFTLLLCFIFSNDMQEILNPANDPSLSSIFDACNFCAYALTVLCHVYLVNYLYNLKINRVFGVVFIIYSLAACVLYGIFTIFNLQYIVCVAYIPAVVFAMAKFYLALVKNRDDNYTFSIVVTIFSAATGAQITAFLARIQLVTPPHAYGIETTYSLLIVMLFATVYVLFLLRTEREALKASQYKLQTEQLKTRLMREQINPHFIFNSLIMVKEAYRAGIERGDLAMHYFSRHLRANVEALDMDRVPFEQELNNIENYIGLVNIGRGKSVNVIYDIDYDDFSVPVLSLQSFVENAVKYAKIDETEGGYIMLSAKKTDGEILVTVEDNGAGFDQNAVKESSCGIRNAAARFSLLLGANLQVESEIGRGTKVTITIPQETTDEGEKDGTD